MIVIEFDPAKDAANRQKHGFGLAVAAGLFEGPVFRQIDDRRNYHEERWLAIGCIGDDFFCRLLHDARFGLQDHQLSPCQSKGA